MNRRARKLYLAVGAFGLLGGLGIAGIGVEAANATPSATTYGAVPLYLGDFTTLGFIDNSSHLEQTVVGPEGGLWTSVYGGTGAGDLLRVSGAGRTAYSVVKLPAGIDPIDGVQVGKYMYYMNATSSTTCPVVAFNPFMLGTPTSVLTVTHGKSGGNKIVDTINEFDFSGMAIKGSYRPSDSVLSCPGGFVNYAYTPKPGVVPPIFYEQPVTASFSIGSDGTNAWFSTNSGPYAPYNVNTSTGYVDKGVIYEVGPTGLITPYSLGANAPSIDRSVTAFNGSVYVGDDGGDGSIIGYTISTMTSPTVVGSTVNENPNAPTNTYTLLSGTGGLGDLQGIQAASGPQLWFLREFNNQVGYVDLTTGNSFDYGVSGNPTGQIEGMNPDSTGGLWISMGSVNGYLGGGVTFGRINTASLDVTSGSYDGTINPQMVPIPSGIPTFGADDFALDNGMPTLFINAYPETCKTVGYSVDSAPATRMLPLNCPILSVIKTDSVGHQPSVGVPFNYTIQVTVQTQGNSEVPLPSLSEGQAISAVDTMPAGISASAAAGTGWVCVITGSGSTVSCSYAVLQGQALAPGTALPPIVVTAVASNSTVGLKLNNNVKVVSNDAPMVSNFDQVVPVSTPETTATTSTTIPTSTTILPSTPPGLASTSSATTTTSASTTTTTPVATPIASAASSGAPTQIITGTTLPSRLTFIGLAVAGISLVLLGLGLNGYRKTERHA